MGALMYPAWRSRRARARRAVLGLDLALGLLAVASALYLIWFEQALYDRGQSFSAADWVFSIDRGAAGDRVQRAAPPAGPSR